MNKWLKIIGFILITCVIEACLTPYLMDKETVLITKQIMDDSVSIRLMVYVKSDSMTIKMILKNRTREYISLDEGFELNRHDKNIHIISHFPIYLVTHDYFYKMRLIKPLQSVCYEWKTSNKNIESVILTPVMCYSLDKIYKNYPFRIRKEANKKYIVVTDIRNIHRMYGDIDGFSGPYVKLSIK